MGGAILIACISALVALALWLLNNNGQTPTGCPPDAPAAATQIRAGQYTCQLEQTQLIGYGDRK